MFRLEDGGHCLAYSTSEFNLWNLVKHSRDRVPAYDNILEPYITEKGKKLVVGRLDNMLDDDLHIALRSVFIKQGIVTVTTKFPLKDGYFEVLETACARLIRDGHHRLVIARCEKAGIEPPSWDIKLYEAILHHENGFSKEKIFRDRFFGSLMASHPGHSSYPQYIEMACTARYGLVTFLDTTLRERITETAAKVDISSVVYNVHTVYKSLVKYCKLLLAIAMKCYNAEVIAETEDFIYNATRVIPALNVLKVSRPKADQSGSDRDDSDEE
jgi:hypothetical protein